MRPLPVEAILAATFAMSQGARNWPFLTLIAAPVRPAASRRSVCRDRKAGICSTSTASATGAQWSGRWTSVRTGQPMRAADLGEDAQALVHADAALGAETEVRFALS